MAAEKKKTSTKKVAQKQMSWRKLLIAASVVANISFVVLIITMATTNSLDGMFMKEGLKRYCLGVNNDKFADAGEYANALREYTCASGEAKAYFENGFNEYLDYKDIPKVKVVE